VRVGGPPIRLIPGKVFTIGRANEANLTVPSQRVSRNHAEIRWSEGKALLCDLGSQNGTLVNGKRIRGEYALKQDDELEFGPFMCTFRSSGAKAPAEPDVNALTQPMLGDAMAGRLDQIQLPELLQTLEFNGKTGTLEIFGADGEGFVVVRDGRPVYAEIEGGRTGDEAVFELLSYTSGQFSFSGDISEDETNITTTMGSLLMEAARRADEG
jgi:hypothetical protein